MPLLGNWIRNAMPISGMYGDVLGCMVGKIIRRDGSKLTLHFHRALVKHVLTAQTSP